MICVYIYTYNLHNIWYYIMHYNAIYHDILSTKWLILSKSCIWYQIFRQAQMPQIMWMILDLGLTFTKWGVNRFRNKKMHCAVLNCLVLLCLRLQLWVVCDGCDGVLPGCLARLSYQNMFSPPASTVLWKWCKQQLCSLLPQDPAKRDQWETEIRFLV